MLAVEILCLAPPVVWLAAFVAGLARHGRCPSWVLVIALVPTVFDLIWVVGWLLDPGEDSLTLPVALMAYLCVAIGAILWTLWSQHRERARRTLTFLGLALPLPVMALSVYLFIVIATQPPVAP